MAEWIPYAIDVAKRAAGAPLRMKVGRRAPEMVGSYHARRLRKQMLVPCTLVNTKPRCLLTADVRDIVKQYRHPSWTTRVLDLMDENDEKIERVLMRNIAWHPLRESPLAVDFAKYDPCPERGVMVHIPIEVEGVARNAALAMGGYPHVMRRAIPVFTYLDPIPPSIKINIANLGMKQSLRLSELWHGGSFPDGIWPAVQGSSPNRDLAFKGEWADVSILKIGKL